MMRQWGVVVAVAAHVLAVPQVVAQDRDGGFRFTVRQRTAAPRSLRGPVETRDSETTVRVRDGRVRVDYLADENPGLRKGTWVLLEARTGQQQVVDSGARTVMLFGSDAASAGLRSLLMPRITTDTSSTRDDLGPGDTIAGVPTRRLRITTRYTSRKADMPGSEMTYAAIATLDVSDALAALDPGFDAYLNRLLGQTNLPAPAAGDSTVPRVRIGGFVLQADIEDRTSFSTVTSITTHHWRVTEFTRGGVAAADLVAPTGYATIDVAAQMRRELEALKEGPPPGAPRRP